MNQPRVPVALAISAIIASATVACATTSAPANAPANVPAAARPAAAPTVRSTLPAPPMGLSPALPGQIDSLINAAIADHAAPAMAVAIGRYDRLIYLHSYGRLTYADTAAPVDVDTRFDLASLTKVVATTTAAMMLEEEGRLDINRTVASYLPEFNSPEKNAITVRMLITHRGGLEAFAPLWRTLKGREQYLAAINSRPLAYAPGTRSIYSDWDFVLLGLIVERVTGQPLDAFVGQHIFGPLGMSETGFRPDTVDKRHIAPTEIDSLRGQVWGSVHDENANALGGVAGHAGLFSTARDLSIFARMLLNGGSVGSIRLLAPSTIARWTSAQDAGSSRALGWDTPSPHSSAGRFFSPRSYGHTGFTGTSIWTDPERGVWVILLTNRVSPTRNNNKHIALRRAVADAVEQAVTDAPLVDWEALQRPSAPDR
jgi:CubicO group peptidase (beta-lactamase class C family)